MHDETQMPPENPLPRLREIRDQQRSALALVPERDLLIRQALSEGKSENQVAEASGLSQPRIHEIAIGDQ
jgi:DNA-binding NarL/FixJ family response regulator